MKVYLLALCVVFSNIAHAGKLKFPVPAGYLYDPPNYSIVSNPAALPREKGMYLTGQYEPSDAFGASLVGAGAQVGAGAGYSRVDTGTGSGSSDSLFGGAGVKLGKGGLGFSLVDNNLSNQFNPQINLAAMINAGKVDVGLFLYDVGETNQPVAAVGYASKQVSLEGSLAFPGFDQVGGSGSTYTLGIAGAIYGSIFSVAWETYYATSLDALTDGALSHVIAGSMSLGKVVTFHVQLYSTERVVFGLTIGF